ncbi:phosphonate degradation HD-domain oxygenase [Tumidithrix helvetica PCC 7403]|uniref:phosphonate degradation HD-domain oxygenase n=1 Tax=Tumidithrix helvetica TaxID=3457545 RepID=UPI003C7FD937
MKFSLDEILDIFATRGHAQYGGEPVSQLEHGLQCATLARERGASSELITACLLHDLGHLLHDLGENCAEKAIDSRHEYEGVKPLELLFPPTVTEPIRLHVEAKRYLCAADPTYLAGLSLASQSSLILQGGIFSKEEAFVFMGKPYAKDAVSLRAWDDLAKVEGLKTPDLNDFVTIVASCLR